MTKKPLPKTDEFGHFIPNKAKAKAVLAIEDRFQPELIITMGYSDEQIEESVGHIIEAFSFGAPPHGGIALGLDRHVALLQNEASIKEVMAFPMTSTGRTAVMDAPSLISEEQIKELGIKIVK